MQDRVNSDIGTSEPEPELELDWNSIDWSKANRKVKNLRQRIYRATQQGQWKQVRNLQKLMMRSYSNLLLSIRRVTQDNQGKKTPGVDGQKALTPPARAKLAREMQTYQLWQVKPTRRIYIPKANGKLRPLSIPTIKDRVAQNIVKNALEPHWEYRFEANSYGFRPGRSCHDAIEQCWIRLNANGSDKWILDADLAGAFDNILHEFIQQVIGNSPGRGWIKAWLKAGYLEQASYHPTPSGTPQGGVVSPLLLNVALNGMEELLNKHTKLRFYEIKTGKEKGRLVKKRVNTYGFSRYADDFVITAQSREELENLIPELKEWLAKRGLKFNPDKTRIRYLKEGFNFLGFNLRQYKTKCLVKPQKEKVQSKLRELKLWLKQHPDLEPAALIRVLNPILRGWANYYKHAVSKRIFAYFDHRMVQLLLSWAKRRHPNKGVKWVVRRYFGTIGGDHWVFKGKDKDRRGNPRIQYLYRLSTTKIVRHTKVKGKASPDDPELKTYWRNRNTTYGKNYYGFGTKLYQVAQNQKWKCSQCRQQLFNGERIHLHHLQEVHKGGTDQLENLRLVHQECHKQLHGGSSQLRCQELEPDDR